MTLKFYKKGGFPDGIFLIVSLFALAVIFLMAYVMFGSINNEMQASSVLSSQAKSNAADTMSRYPTMFDNIFLFVVVGLGIAVIVGAYFIRSHPALFWFSVPVMAFLIWLGALYANIFTEIKSNEEVKVWSAGMPIMVFIFENYAIVITGFILLLALALYAKPRLQ